MQELRELIGNSDIYLIDQILKGRYLPHQKILDAGCGQGRNLPWFIKNDLPVYAVDRNEEAISSLRLRYPGISERFTVAALEKLPYANNFFDHIISSAVLHFSTSTDHFYDLLSEHVRILKSNGTLLIRMTSDISLEKRYLQPVGKGVYQIPDGSTRFLLTRELYVNLKLRFKLKEIEPIKTTNVNDIRAMTTIVLQK